MELINHLHYKEGLRGVPLQITWFSVSPFLLHGLIKRAEPWRINHCWNCWLKLSTNNLPRKLLLFSVNLRLFHWRFLNYAQFVLCLQFRVHLQKTIMLNKKKIDNYDHNYLATYKKILKTKLNLQTILEINYIFFLIFKSQNTFNQLTCSASLASSSFETWSSTYSWSIQSKKVKE